MLHENNRPGELKQVWGNWLTELGDQVGGWDWWATLTFRDRTDAQIKRGWTRVGVKHANMAWSAFMNELRACRGLGEPTWVRGMEYQHWRGVPHFHALLSGVKNLRRDEAWQWWFKRFGLARILPYDRQLGAGFYLCKYVVKELGDIQFSDGFDSLVTTCYDKE
ncbi:hypothetical protein ES705_47490 [subsurface metagenome]